MADSITAERLLDLYRLALDEYRFEVRLGWDRTTYFLAVGTAFVGDTLIERKRCGQCGNQWG